VRQNPWSRFDPDGRFWSAILTVACAAYDTYQYATGKISGAEYTRNMVVNAAALAADVITAGNGGGMAVRAAALSCRAKTAIVATCKAIEKADTVVSTIEAAVDTVKAVKEGDVMGAVVGTVSTAMGAKSSAAPMDCPKFCFAAGTRVHTTRGPVPVDALRVGMRVWTPETLAGASDEPAPKAEDYVEVVLLGAPLARPDLPCEITLLRSRESLMDANIGTGSVVELGGNELSLSAARVVELRPVAQIDSGPGRLVTATYHTWNDSVGDLQVSGESAAIQVTSGHTFMSGAAEDAWVAAAAFRLGDTIRTREGHATVTGTHTPTRTWTPVFNIEVASEHCYYVGNSGLLAHNNGDKCNNGLSAKNVSDEGKGAVKGGIYEFPDQKAGGTPYVGQSGDLEARLKKHESTGRLKSGTETTTEVSGDKTAREIAEHKRIQKITGGVPASKSGAVSNKVDPIGPKRRHLLDEE
jgi:hypothetical protein